MQKQIEKQLHKQNSSKNADTIISGDFEWFHHSSDFTAFEI